jgi:enolase
MEAIEKAGHSGKINIAMDPAASEIWQEDKKVYDLDFKTENNNGS